MKRYSWPEIEKRVALAIAAEREELSLYGCHVQDHDLHELMTEPGIEKIDSLNLTGNQLTALPPEIGRLTNLTMLDLTDNQLTALPSEINRLTDLRSLFLHGNDALGIPPEILGPTEFSVRCQAKKPASPKAILDYYFRTQTQPTRPLNEAKVLLVGEAAVGKTSLVGALVRNEYCLPGRKMTDGIRIDCWKIEGKRTGERIQLNVWDFGGQEIMHATHQFFLTRRSLYLVVLDARQNEKQCRLEYWLRLVQSFGGDSPIIVVVNKIDDGGLKLDRNGLMKKYEPNLRGFIETSCQNMNGVNDLRELIGREVRGMAHVDNELPESYFVVKQELEQRKETTPHLLYTEYTAICREHGVNKADEQDQLAQFLHDLGTILSFRHDDRLAALGVLSPKWVTEGVYAIITSERLNRASGILHQECLEHVLPSVKYPPDKRSFIVEMMKKFELCFEFDEGTGRRWLIPGLLDKELPPLDWEKESQLVRFEYRYAVLPGSVIWRFIVRNHGLLGAKPVYWRSGVVIHVDGAEALVIADEEDKQVLIKVRGSTPGQRRAALTHVRMELEHIHANMPRIEPKGKVPLPDCPEVAVEYQHLLRLEGAGTERFLPEGAEHEYSVADLLEGVSTKEQRTKDRQRRRSYKDLPDPQVGGQQRKMEEAVSPVTAFVWLFGLVIIGAGVVGVLYILSDWLTRTLAMGVIALLVVVFSYVITPPSQRQAMKIFLDGILLKIPALPSAKDSNKPAE